MNETITKTKGVSGSTLKIIAITAMLIDHIGAVIIERIMIANNFLSLDFTNAAGLSENAAKMLPLVSVYFILRIIGRLGFPIFCFLLIEGFVHTRNVWKYALRLLLFALVSEVPFDLALRSSFFDLGYQNVFFTLFFGLMAITFINMAQEKFKENNIVRLLLLVVISIFFMGMAFSLHTDYSLWGVLTIIAMYTLRKNKTWEMAIGCAVLTVSSFIEVFAFVLLLPIRKYNGERGLNLKYIFYAFYPVHLLILYLITYFMGIADVFKGLY